MHGVSHVPEFVGITHDIDGDDAAILNLQGGGLENVAPLDGDEPRQAVDKAIAYQARPATAKRAANVANSRMTSSSPATGAVSRRLSAAVGVDGDVRREQRA